MRFAEWPPRRIMLTWVLGLGLWGLLTALAYRGSRDTRSGSLARNELLEVGDISPASSVSTAGRDSFLAIAFAALRLPSGARDSLLAKVQSLSRDSSLTITQRRDSVSRLLNAPAQLTPAQKDSLKRLADSMIAPLVAGLVGRMDSVLSKAAPMIYLSMALYFAIPVLLVAMTLVWWLLRRRASRPVNAAAA
jgi:hypothetical protein